MANFPLSRREPTGGTTPLGDWGVDSEHGVLRDVVIGPADHYRWQTGNAMSRRSMRLGLEFDADVARQQYAEMIAAYEDAGVTCHFLRPDAALPYQVYARDSSVMTPWGAIVTQLQSPWRRGEWRAVVELFQSLDLPVYDVVTAGSFEGGDYMVLAPGVVLCGCSGDRTSEAGLAQVRGWFEAEGWEFVPYEFDPYFLHIDVKMAMLAEGLAAVCVEAVEDHLVDWLRGRGIEIIDIPYKALVGLEINVVALGDERVLIPRSSKLLADRCRAHGLAVLDPDISMFTAGGGGVHCMCQALRRDRLS
ncbi:MAG: arginine deiminase family protein [Planctomycetota bacterium]